jgi:hypothetical protein
MPAAFAGGIRVMPKPNHGARAKSPWDDRDQSDLPGIRGASALDDFRHPKTDEVVGNDGTEIDETEEPHLRTPKGIGHTVARFTLASF